MGLLCCMTTYNIAETDQHERAQAVFRIGMSMAYTFVPLAYLGSQDVECDG